MSGEVPIETLLIIIFFYYYFFTGSIAFLGTFSYPKIQKFICAHLDCRKMYEIPTFHIQKRSLAPPTGFTRYNTPPNSKLLQILHICAAKCALHAIETTNVKHVLAHSSYSVHPIPSNFYS